MENREIAAVFEEISNLMKILQDDPKWTFKAAAYDRAKRSIESYPERLEDIARDPSRKLTDIPGIGADLAKKIAELVETGQSSLSPGATRQNPAQPARPAATANRRPSESAAVLPASQHPQRRRTGSRRQRRPPARLAGNEREVGGKHPEGH